MNPSEHEDPAWPAFNGALVCLVIATFGMFSPWGVLAWLIAIPIVLASFALSVLCIAKGGLLRGLLCLIVAAAVVPVAASRMPYVANLLVHWNP